MARRTITIWNQSSFDSDYSPPVPQLALEISGPDLNKWYMVENAVVDTGADWTIIPESILSQIEAYEWDQARLRSQWGESRTVYRYEIDMRIAAKIFRGVLVVSDDMGNEVIIGRNLLNWLKVLIDGPNQKVELIE